MRGQLFIIAGGATLAVGALTFAATAAYAAPIPTSSSAVAHSPALVIPANYRPAAPVAQPVSPSGTDVIHVTPEAAVDIADGIDNSRATSPSSTSPGAPVGTGDDSTGAAPPVGSTPPASSGRGTSGDDNGSNAGNGGDNKGSGSDKSGSNNSGSNNSGSNNSGSNNSGSNNGNDVNNKGTGSNKGKGKSGD
ncbi:MAG TPA: hypothetical protein VIJ11_01495 [Galbitalea sp.]